MLLPDAHKEPVTNDGVVGRFSKRISDNEAEV